MEAARRASDGLDRDRWRALAELGMFGLTRPEAEGGTGLQLVDAAIVFEELGRALVPGPLVPSFLATDPAGGERVGTAPRHRPATADTRGERADDAAPHPVRDALAGVITGEVVATLVEPEAGQPVLIEHLGSADVVLVLRDDGVSCADGSAVAAAAQPVGEPVDPTTPLWLVDAPADGEVVDGRLDGEALGGAELAARWRRVGAVLTSALLVGVAQRAIDLAVDYAKDRQQFGRAIGSFQALKHIMADMFARTEVARAGLHAAAVVADDPEIGDDERAVAGARALAGEAAVHNAKDCIQVHGGIGFTWEADPHLLYKRALLYGTQFGSVDQSAETVAHRLATPATRA